MYAEAKPAPASSRPSISWHSSSGPRSARGLPLWPGMRSAPQGLRHLLSAKRYSLKAFIRCFVALSVLKARQPEVFRTRPSGSDAVRRVRGSLPEFDDGIRLTFTIHGYNIHAYEIQGY